MKQSADQARLGVLVLERDTGLPLSGVPVLAFLEMEAEEGAIPPSIPLGLLASDHAGYASFDLSLLDLGDKAKRPMHLWVQVYGQEGVSQAVDLPGLAIDGMVAEDGVVGEDAVAGQGSLDGIVLCLLHRRAQGSDFVPDPSHVIGQSFFME